MPMTIQPVRSFEPGMKSLQPEFFTEDWKLGGVLETSAVWTMGCMGMQLSSRDAMAEFKNDLAICNRIISLITPFGL